MRKSNAAGQVEPVSIAEPERPTIQIKLVKQAQPEARPSMKSVVLFGVALCVVFGYLFYWLEKSTPVDEVKVAAAQAQAHAHDVEKRAEAGDADAEVELGASLLDNDSQQARGWFEKAAAQGNGAAESYLGYMYENGKGVPIDLSQARAWYQKGAAQGNSNAKSQLDELSRKNP